MRVGSGRGLASLGHPGLRVEWAAGTALTKVARLVTSYPRYGQLETFLDCIKRIFSHNLAVFIDL